MVKTAVKHEGKKNALVEVAERLFLEKGYEETSIEDILMASGLSKGGFYHYFRSKDEVLMASIGNFADSLLREIEPIIEDSSLDALQKLRRVLDQKTVMQEKRRGMIRYLAMLMKSDFMVYRYGMVIVQKYVYPMARIIEQGVKEGVFKVEHPLETADILLRVLNSVPQSMFFHDYMEDEEKSKKYKRSVEDLMSRTLGVDGSGLKIY
jgi:AcrR family transcriptional regulator